jgi:hypothetical protein
MTQEQFVVDLQRRRNELVEEAESIRQLLVQDPALDRADKDKESLRVLVVAALNGLHWRDRELASLKQENERLKLGPALKYERFGGSAHLTEITALKAKVVSLQLENGVMSSGLTDIRGIHHNCGQCNCALTSGESQCETYQVADKALLSTSTKSSLMEKVHSLLNALKPFEQRIDGWRKHLKKGSITEPISKEWLAVESALTEVKKEMA